MKQQPDELFHNKLKDFSKTVPPAAWDRIDAGMGGKKLPYFRLAAAASFLLISIATYLLWPVHSDQPELTSKIENQKREYEDTLIQEPYTDEPAEAIPSNEQSQFITKKIETQEDIVAETRKKNSRKVLPNTQRQKSGSDTETKAEVIDEKEISEEILLAEVIPAEPKTENFDKGDHINSSEKIVKDDHIRIVLSAEETNEYLEINSIAEATPSEKKTSTLRKVLKKASDLKTNQDPFGDLRQMKNEILALNFKSDKQRGQNK